MTGETIEIHLYGKLRRFGPQADTDRECLILMPIEAATTVGELLQKAGIPLDEVSNIFLDGFYDRDAIEKPVAGLARIGVFPKDMSLLYV